MKSVILAGGLGTRLGSLTSAINKSLLPIDDLPIISHLLRFAQKANTDVLLTTTLGQVDNFARVVVTDPQICEKNVYYNIQVSPVGIADALKYAKNFCNYGPVLVILGDNLFESTDYDAILNVCNNNKNSAHFGAHIWVTPREDFQNYGVIELNHGLPVQIVEKPVNSNSKLVITGVYMFDSQLWNILESLKPSARGEYEITDVLNRYLMINKVTVNYLKSDWHDIGQSVDSYWSIVKRRINCGQL